jgi:hypothetical protein
MRKHDAHPRRAGHLAFGLAGALALAACRSEDNPTRAFKTTRIEEDAAVRWGAPAMQRLGVRMPGAVQPQAEAGAAPEDPMQAMGAGISAVPSDFSYSLPAGWSELQPSATRNVNLLAGDPALECYVTVLGGGAGGVAGNVNRWRDQVGLEPISSAEVEALPRLAMLGGEAHLAEAIGAEKAILGTLSARGSTSVFVKMIGPRELVARERDAFLAFCASLGAGDAR